MHVVGPLTPKEFTQSVLAYLNYDVPQKHLCIDDTFKFQGFCGHFLMKKLKKEEESTEQQTLMIGKYVLQHLRCWRYGRDS